MTAYAVVMTMLLVFPWAVLGTMGVGAAVTRLRSLQRKERHQIRDARISSKAGTVGLARALPARATSR